MFGKDVFLLNELYNQKIVKEMNRETTFRDMIKDTDVSLKNGLLYGLSSFFSGASYKIL